MDAFAVTRAVRAGYAFSQEGDLNFYNKNGKKTGPFKTLDDAAYAAIIEDEYNYESDPSEEEDDNE